MMESSGAPVESAVPLCMTNGNIRHKTAAQLEDVDIVLLSKIGHDPEWEVTPGLASVTATILP
jgi:hypothetical protein